MSIVVKNPAPAQDNGESEAFSKPVNALQSAGTISGVSEICPGESNVELSVPTNSDVTSYQWTVVSGGATIVSGGNTRTARLNFGNTAGPVQVSVVAFNTCGKPGPATTRTITIKPTPVVTVSAQNDDTAVCQGESVVLSAAGANSYVWSGTGIAAGTTGNTLTVTPTVTTTYTVIGTTDDCPSAPRTITINVTPALTQGVISGVNEYCHNASATAITASITGGGSATKSYKWERSTTGANGLWTEVGTSANFTPLTTATGTSWYRRTVSAGECSVTSAAFPVLVKSNPTITVEASENAICQGETVELTAEGADSYIWSGTGMPAGATSDKVTVTPTVTTTYTVVGVIDGCQSTPQTVTITVTPTLTQGAITGVTQYCQTVGGFGTALSSTVGGGVAAKSYLWEQSPNGTSDWEPAENTNNGASYTPSISEAGTMYYRRAVESGSCVSIGEPVAVTVTPSITNTITSANQVVCSGETISQITGTVLGGSPDEVSYQWEQSANGTSGWGDAPGASKDLNYTPEEEVVNTSKTTYYRRKVVSGNCTSFSEPVSIRIVAMPIAEILDGANDYFCPPASATLTARTGTGYRYTWYKVVQGGDDEHVGTDQNTYTTNVEGYYYVVVKGENDCTTTSSVTQVQSTILNTNIISGAQTICYNAIPTTLEGQTSTSDLGTVTYQWRVSSNGTSFSNITGATDKDFTFTSSLTGDKWYRRVARVGSGCSITSEPVKVTVKPLLRVTNLASASSALCTGTAFTFSPEGSEGSKSFTWTRAEVVGISNDAASGTGGINETLVNTTAAAVNVTYMYTTSDDEGCSGPVQNLVVRVNPTPTLSSLLAPPAICGGAEFDYTARSATSNTTFSWVRKPVAGITTTADASGSGARVEHILTNTTPNPIDVTYTYTLTANGCSNTQNVVVRVNPRPHLNTTLTPAAICSGATFSYEPDSDTEEETYTWTRTAPASISGGATSGTGSISQVLTNASANPVNVTYQFITSANSCAGTPQDVVVTVNPSPKLSSLLTANVCSGNTFSYEPASATEGSTFSWSRSASGGNAASSGTGNISEVLTNTTTAPITVTYEITARANGCNGEPQNLVVTVHPRPVLNNIPTSASVCSGSVFSYTPQSLTPNASFTWTRAAVNGISNAAVTSPRAGSISETLVNTTTDPIDVTYVYTTTANNCAGSEQNVVITVNPRPVLSSTLTADPVCSGTPFSYTPQSATIGATFSWTRAAVANISNTAVTTAVAGDINETLINTGTAPVTVTYKYTTTYASNGSSCSGTEQDVKVVVNPSPKLSSTLTPTAVCSSSTFSYTPTSATTGATYTWTRAAVAGISNTAVTDGTGAVSETLVNTTANTINVTYVYIITANGCTGTPQNVTVRVNPKPDATFSGVTDGQIVYSDGGTISLTPTVAGGNFSIVSPSGTNGMTSGGVLTPCTALVSETEKEITIRYTLAQTSNSVACNAFEEKKVILKRSKYVVVIEAVPFPTCRGQNTTYRAVVYKDPVSVTYPYLVNGDGQPVDGQGNLLGAKTYPIPNPAYPFPANAPQILKDNAYRYYQPIVNGGVRVNDDANASNFTYRWTKNFDNFPFGDKVEVGNAGLSSEDYYAVSITAGPTNSCISPITNGGLWSNRTYTAAPINYVVDLVTDKTTICQDGEITMSANLDAAFAFWKDIELTLYWMVQRPGITAPIQLGSTTYTTGNTVTFNSTGPTGGFRDGDLVFVEFSSVIDRQNDVNSKCSRGFTTNQVALTVVGTQTMTGGGAYCAGGGGVPVGLASSQRNVFYQLKRDGANVGTPMAGTGNALNFANQTVAGAYTVEAQAASGETACLTYGPVNVNVTPLPVVQTLTTENDGEFCAGGIGVPITLSNSQTGVKYQLVRTVNGTTTNVGLEVLGSDGQPIPFGNQTEAGVYSVEATTLPATGTIAACPQTMGSVIVTVNQLPTVTVNSPTICEGSTATITAEPAGGTGPYTYTWSVPAGFTNPGNVASFSTTVPGTYTVSIGDSKSCASSAAATSTVIVNELPTVTVNSPTVCAGTAATVTATPADGVGPYSYTWTVPAGATNPGNVASFPTSVAGQYSVRIQDSQSCSSSEVATSTVTINPVLPVTARILIFDETGTQIEDESKMEFGMKYTFEVESNMIDLNGVDISSIKWWMGDGTTEGWVMVEQGVTQFTMKEPMGALRVSIKCDIPALPGTCFALDASNIFSIFTDPIVPLPVELLYFNATKRGNDVVLDWATASELDNKGFEVQVSSDAKNFRALGFVESKVNTTSLKQLYTFVDKENGKQGVRYYRLKQVDLDGKFEIFNVKAVHFDEVSVNKVKAYPNPFHSEVELSIDAELDGELQITVTTATGQQLLQRSVQVVKGTNIEKLTLDPNLPRGVYIISTRMGDFNSHFKLLKQ
ncbi:T9SS type A sorting domain-containing protein [Pontibacter sp. HSC-14F20]|uniref:PKD-like domain-containing protein n=1 Tax=Pontibacter sp. HSC-14F20 TaxID=2864136 RepID=UPI001C72E667|nr:PKD-like domain-containing protein [Pontibacter sp. HSC-14F20]MBX0333188.1 T9SS type A sorting domain-containing protein [Pontibacter sp. HSC-14F20]